MPKAFFSFANHVVADTWVKSAARLFVEQRIEAHVYKTRPELGVNLDESLLARIRESDIFVAVLNEEYLKRTITVAELREATTLATGTPSSNLKHQSGGPHIILLWEDPYARDWLERTHPGFPYLALDDYEFANSGDGPLPKNSGLWQALFKEVRERLAKPRHEQRNARTPDVPSGGSPLLVLGRPVGSFDPETKSAHTELLERLRDAEPAMLDDDWASHARRADSGEQLRHHLGARTVTVQVCDQGVYEANEQVPGDSLGIGKDHEAKLLKLGFGPEKSRDVLTRTVFWVPRRIEGIDSSGVPDPDQRRAAFCGASVGELSTWLSEHVDGPEVVLKSQPGLDDIAGQLKTALETGLGRIDFGAWSEKSFEDSIREGLEEGGPLLVAIHDRNLPWTADKPRKWLSRQAESCEKVIGKIVDGRVDIPIGRAIFLVRNPDLTHDDSIVAGATWLWVPLRSELRYAPAEERLSRLRTQLRPNASAALHRT